MKEMKEEKEGGRGRGKGGGRGRGRGRNGSHDKRHETNKTIDENEDGGERGREAENELLRDNWEQGQREHIGREWGDPTEIPTPTTTTNNEQQTGEHVTGIVVKSSSKNALILFRTKDGREFIAKRPQNYQLKSLSMIEADIPKGTKKVTKTFFKNSITREWAESVVPLLFPANENEREFISHSAFTKAKITKLEGSKGMLRPLPEGDFQYKDSEFYADDLGPLFPFLKQEMHVVFATGIRKTNRDWGEFEKPVIVSITPDLDLILQSIDHYAPTSFIMGMIEDPTLSPTVIVGEDNIEGALVFTPEQETKLDLGVHHIPILEQILTATQERYLQESCNPTFGKNTRDVYKKGERLIRMSTTTPINLYINPYNFHFIEVESWTRHIHAFFDSQHGNKVKEVFLLHTVNFACTADNWKGMTSFTFAHHDQDNSNLERTFFFETPLEFGRWDGESPGNRRFGGSEDQRRISLFTFNGNNHSATKGIETSCEKLPGLNDDEWETDTSPEDVSSIAGNDSWLVSIAQGAPRSNVKLLTQLTNRFIRSTDRHTTTYFGTMAMKNNDGDKEDETKHETGGEDSNDDQHRMGRSLRDDEQKMVKSMLHNPHAGFTPFTMMPGDVWMDSKTTKLTIIFHTIASPNLLYQVTGTRAAIPQHEAPRELTIVCRDDDEVEEIVTKMTKTNKRLYDQKYPPVFAGYYQEGNRINFFNTRKSAPVGMNIYYVGGIPPLLSESKMIELLMGAGFKEEEVRSTRTRLIQLTSSNTHIAEIHTMRVVKIVKLRGRNFQLTEEPTPSREKIEAGTSNSFFINSRADENEVMPTEQYRLPTELFKQMSLLGFGIPQTRRQRQPVPRSDSQNPKTTPKVVMTRTKSRRKTHKPHLETVLSNSDNSDNSGSMSDSSLELRQPLFVKPTARPTHRPPPPPPSSASSSPPTSSSSASPPPSSSSPSSSSSSHPHPSSSRLSPSRSLTTSKDKEKERKKRQEDERRARRKSRNRKGVTSPEEQSINEDDNIDENTKEPGTNAENLPQVERFSVSDEGDEEEDEDSGSDANSNNEQNEKEETKKQSESEAPDKTNTADNSVSIDNSLDATPAKDQQNDVVPTAENEDSETRTETQASPTTPTKATTQQSLDVYITGASSSKRKNATPTPPRLGRNTNKNKKGAGNKKGGRNSNGN
jgi:hypothetical protein